MPHKPWQLQTNWAFFVSQGHRLADVEFREAALSEACKLMQRVRRNVDKIVERLTARGYEFVDPKRLFVPPAKNVADWSIEFAKAEIHLPIAFEAWLREVGEVNLMGTDRNWPLSGYSGLGPDDVWYSDPLVVEVNKQSINYEFQCWQEQATCDGIEEVGPFRIPFAPDDLHKANISGGAPYELRADHPSVDTLVLNERHCCSFVAYLRHAFAWGGFPGFENIENPPHEFLTAMRADLEPF